MIRTKVSTAQHPLAVESEEEEDISRASIVSSTHSLHDSSAAYGRTTMPLSHTTFVQQEASGSGSGSGSGATNIFKVDGCRNVSNNEIPVLYQPRNNLDERHVNGNHDRNKGDIVNIVDSDASCEEIRENVLQTIEIDSTKDELEVLRLNTSESPPSVVTTFPIHKMNKLSSSLRLTTGLKTTTTTSNTTEIPTTLPKSMYMCPSMREKANAVMHEGRGCVILPITLMLFMCSLIFLIVGYNGGQTDGRDKGAATVDDFISIGQRCFVKDIEYHHVTFEDNSNKKSTTTRYRCDEIWQYDFMVLEEEIDMVFEDSPYNEDTGSNFQNAMHSLVEVKPACKSKPCSACNDMLGEYALNGGNPTSDGSFVTECWASTVKELEKVDPFWECSELKVYEDQEIREGEDVACYLFRDPKDILHEFWMQGEMFLLIGWIIFVPFALIFIFLVYALFGRRQL